MDLRRISALRFRAPCSCTSMYVPSRKAARSLSCLQLHYFSNLTLDAVGYRCRPVCGKFRIFITKTGATVETFHFAQANAKKRLTRRLRCVIIILVKNPIGGVASVIFTRQVNSTDHILVWLVLNCETHLYRASAVQREFSFRNERDTAIVSRFLFYEHIHNFTAKK